MKVSYTHIVGIESDQNRVRIMFRPKGSNTADKPVTVDVAPHDSFIHLSFSNIQNRRVLACDLGGNQASVRFGDLTKKL